MAIDPVLTSTATLHVGPGGRTPRGASQSGAERLAERLGELVRTRKAVAAELDSPGRSHSERTVLTARFNDLQRQVNQLDGIVASEGQESAGPTRAPQTTDTKGLDSSQASTSSVTQDRTVQRPVTVTENTTTASTEPADNPAAQVDVVA